MKKSTNFTVKTSSMNQKIRRQYLQLDLKFKFLASYNTSHRKNNEPITVHARNKDEALGKLFILLDGDYEITAIVEQDMEFPTLEAYKTLKP